MDRGAGGVGVYWFVAYLLKVTPAGFVPNEDQSFIMADVSCRPLPPWTHDKDRRPGHDHRQAAAGNEFRCQGGRSGILSGGAGGSYGSLFMNLKDWDLRKGEEHSLTAVINRLFGATSGIKGAKIFFIAPPTLEGFGNTSGFEFQVRIGAAAISLVSMR